MSSQRALTLVDQLRAAADGLIEVVEHVDPAAWSRVTRVGAWAPGKDAEHAAEALAYHLWQVRLTLGQTAGPRIVLERKQATARRSQPEVVALLRQRTEEAANLLLALADPQLDRPPKPPRASVRTLSALVESVLIGHLGVHRADIESKLRG